MDTPIVDERPWGRFRVLAESRDCKVKRIEVEPGKRLSYQRHAHRREHWIVVAGVAHVTLNDVEHELRVGQTIDVPLGAWHRLANRESEPLAVIEVQLGAYFGEDDIERKLDDFGRV